MLLQVRQAYALHSDTGRQVDRYVLYCKHNKHMPYTQIHEVRQAGTCYTASATSVCPTLSYRQAGGQVRVILQEAYALHSGYRQEGGQIRVILLARQAYALHSGTGRQVDRYVLYFRHDKRMPYTQVGRWTGTCYTASTTSVCPTLKYRQAGRQIVIDR